MATESRILMSRPSVMAGAGADFNRKSTLGEQRIAQILRAGLVVTQDAIIRLICR